MKKAIKWLLIVVGALVVLVIVALLVIPMFVDVQQYKPVIEKKVSEATCRPFLINGDLKLSLFPWVGLAFSDLHLGNPPGFQEKDLLSIKSFEVKVRLIPLISKQSRLSCTNGIILLRRSLDLMRNHVSGYTVCRSRSPYQIRKAIGERRLRYQKNKKRKHTCVLYLVEILYFQG